VSGAAAVVFGTVLGAEVAAGDELLHPAAITAITPRTIVFSARRAAIKVPQFRTTQRTVAPHFAQQERAG
jgi:hypothetical protein